MSVADKKFRFLCQKPAKPGVLGISLGCERGTILASFCVFQPFLRLCDFEKAYAAPKVASTAMPLPKGASWLSVWPWLGKPGDTLPVL